MNANFLVLLDIEDTDLLSVSWTISKTNRRKVQYAVRTISSKTTKCGTTAEYMHRVVMARTLGRKLKRNEDVDHKNRNGLDNRRENLRLATRSQNKGNVSLQSNNTSGYKGVSWHKRYQKWQAYIKKDGVVKCLGYFTTPEEAYVAYTKKAFELFGEFTNVGEDNG